MTRRVKGVGQSSQLCSDVSDFSVSKLVPGTSRQDFSGWLGMLAAGLAV